MSEQITPEMIKELRDRTGVGIGKCKEALQKTQGDIDEAIAYLRKMGIASAVKKESRATHEGMIGIAKKDQSVAVVEVNAETDFVVNNARFQEFLENIAEEVAATCPNSLDSFLSQQYSRDASMTIDEYRATIVQAIGENIQISRLQTFIKDADDSIGVYTHLGGKIVTVVEISGSSSEEELANNIAMHIAAAAPDYVKPEDVPQNVLEHEREIARSQIKDKKPEHITEKIVEGKVSKFFDAVCLNSQLYIKDDTITVGELVNRRSKELGKPLTIKGFIRWKVGG